MKLSILLEDLLTELSPKEIYQRYYEKDFPGELWSMIVQYDPKTVVKNGEIIKVGRYSKIILDLYKSNKLKKEDLPKAKEYLGYVYKYNIPLDVTTINSLGDIYNLVQRYIVNETTDFSKIMEMLNEGSDYDLLLNGNDWIILTPNNEKAACQLGSGTEWCTTWGKQSLNPKHKDRSNQFQRYNGQGELYIIVNKKNYDEKYQFHFPTKQFMDKRDVNIDLQYFFDNNTEVKNFFFPSLVSSKPPNEWEVNNFSFLPPSDAVLIVKKLGEEFGDNQLCNAIINIDNDRINELIQDEGLDGVIEIRPHDFSLRIIYRNLPDEISGVSDRLDWLESDLSSSNSRVYEMVSEEMRYSDYPEEMSVKIFKEFYDNNAEYVNYDLKARNFEEFERLYFEDFKDKWIRDILIDEIVDRSEEDYETAYQNEINEIKKYINIDQHYGEVILMGPYLIKFLIESKTESIENLSEFIPDYLFHYNVPEGYDEFPEFYLTYPEYSEIEDKISDYFSELEEERTGEYMRQCVEYREKFRHIFQTIFKNKNTLDNDHVRIYIPNPVVNCENGSVYIEYQNKDTGKTYRGEVKVDSLGTYAQNYSLFEEFSTFKNIIK